MRPHEPVTWENRIRDTYYTGLNTSTRHTSLQFETFFPAV